MRPVRIRCAKEEVQQKLYRMAGIGRLSDYCHNKEDSDLPLTRPGDYESRLLTGFKLFEMPEKGYPTD